MRNRRQASASRICEGSLYIALRLILVIPAEAVLVPRGIENYPPGPLWRAQGAVPGVLQGEGLRAEQGTPAAQGRNAPAVGRIGLPHVDPGTAGGPRLGQHTAPRAESGDVNHVHVRVEELLLPQRRADVVLDRPGGGGGPPGLIDQPQLRGRGGRDMRQQQVEERLVLGPGAQRRVITARQLAGHVGQDPAGPGGQLRHHHRPSLEHLPEPVPADSRVHASPMPAPSPAGPRPAAPPAARRPPGYPLLRDRWVSASVDRSRRPGR